MYFVSSVSSESERDAVVEPPGGEALLRSRALLGVPGDPGDPGDPGGLLDARPEGEARAAAETLREAVASGVRPWERARRPSVYECAHCGWYPARRVTFTTHATLLFSSRSRRREQSLCRRCGMRRYWAVQGSCVAFGFLGVGMVVTPFVMLRNAWHRWRMRRLPRPWFRAAEVSARRRTPVSAAVPTVLRVLWWLAVLGALAAWLAAGSAG